MTYPVFASGDVLNASDMNAVGLWLVKTQTIGSAVTTVSVTGAFSADYENYLITINGGVASANSNLTLQLGSTTTGYYSFGYQGAYTSSTVNGDNFNNSANFGAAGYATANALHMNCFLYSPNLAKNTTANFQSVRAATNGIAGNANGFLNDTTQYTAFTVGLSGGANMTGGTIRVYGLRN